MVDPLGLTQRNENGFQSNSEKDEGTTPELCKCNWEENFAQKFYVLCFGVICSFLYVLFLNCIWVLFCQKINEIQRWLQTFAGAVLTLKTKKHQVTFLVRSWKQRDGDQRKKIQDTYSIPNTRCFLCLGPGAYLAQRCSNSLQIQYMRWILWQYLVS